METHERRLSESTAIRLWDMITLLDRNLADYLEPQGITPVELRVLTVCQERENCTATEIAATAPIDPSSISRIVQRLIVRGLLTRRRSSADRRVVFLQLTDSGQYLLDGTYALVENFLAEVTARMDEEDTQAFTRTIASILASLHRPPPPRPTR